MDVMHNTSVTYTTESPGGRVPSKSVTLPVLDGFSPQEVFVVARHILSPLNGEAYLKVVKRYRSAMKEAGIGWILPEVGPLWP